MAEATATRTRTALSWPFIRHFLEMVVAMVVGMVALHPVWTLALQLAGGPDLGDHADLAALVMATDMAIGMTLWMRYRGHGWPSTLEMDAAMFVPFFVLLVPFWTGAVSGEGLLLGGHVLMLPAMVLAMLHRRTEYVQHHGGH